MIIVFIVLHSTVTYVMANCIMRIKLSTNVDYYIDIYYILYSTVMTNECSKTK